MKVKKTLQRIEKKITTDCQHQQW